MTPLRQPVGVTGVPRSSNTYQTGQAFRTKQRTSASSDDQRTTSWSTENSCGKTQAPKYCSSAYPKMMVSSSWKTYTLDPAAITPHLERWSERLSEQVFIGQPRSATQKNWFGIAKDVSFSLRGPTYLPMKFKPSRRLGPLLAGGLT